MAVVAYLLALPLDASKRYVSVGDAARQATLIAIVDIARTYDPPGTELYVREVLKGDSKLRGQHIPLSFEATYLGELIFGAKGVAVAMKGDSVLQGYRQPHEIEALKILIPVYESPSERRRLTQLRDKALATRNPELATALRAQLFADFRQMRDPANYPLLIDLYPRLDEAGQRAVISAIEFIGDPRGVPTLVQALQSKHKWVAIEASNALEIHFPGTVPRPQRGAASISSDLLSILENHEQLEAAVRFRTDWVERSIAEHPREAPRIRASLLPVLKKLAAGDYLQKHEAARVLRVLRHPDTVEPLLSLLGNPDWLYDASTHTAAYALADLGGDARAAAIAKLSKRPDWEELRAPFEASGTPDEVQSLLRQLQRLHTDPRHDNATAANWIIYRLGDLKAKRALPAVVRALDRKPWPPRATVEALIRIGGAETEAAMQPLLTAKDPETRRAAMEVLYALQQERFLPSLRRMVTDPTFGHKTEALVYLGHLGDLSDLAVLVPQSDFWKGDRVHHYFLMSAIAEIRRRHGLRYMMTR